MISEKNLKHPCCVQPASTDTPVWRYMDMLKLGSLLHTKSLYFARLDRLNDPYEGRIGRHGRGQLSKLLATNAPLDQQLDSICDYSERVARNHFVNCWCMHKLESDALWRLYAGASNPGVAIRTTYRRLVEQLPPKSFVGLVKYLDYDSEAFDPGNVLQPVMHKRAQYSYENEVRAVIMPFGHGSGDPGPEFKGLPSGIRCSVEPNMLIEAVVTSPYMEDWQVEAVQSLTGKLGLTAPVIPSQMR